MPPRQRNCQTRAAADAEQRALAVGGGRRLDRRGEVEADRERRRPRPRRLRPRGIEPVLAAQLAAVGGEHQPALVDQAEAAGIAVVARLDPQDAGGLVARRSRPRRRPCRASRPRGSRSSCGRRASGSNGRRWCAARGRARPASAPGLADAAAIDDQPVGAVAELEGEGRGAAAAERARRRRRRRVEHQHARLGLRAADSPSRAPGAAAGRRRPSPRPRRRPGAGAAMLPPCQLDSASSPSVTASRAPTDAGQRLAQPVRHLAARRRYRRRAAGPAARPGRAARSASG